MGGKIRIIGGLGAYKRASPHRSTMAEEAVAVELEVGVNEPETDETVEAGVPRPVEIELTAQELRSPPTKKKKVRSSPDINASREWKQIYSACGRESSSYFKLK